jgi:hypothetical protein
MYLNVLKDGLGTVFHYAILSKKINKNNLIFFQIAPYFNRK